MAMGTPNVKMYNPVFRKLNRAISKHKYEVTVYNPDGSWQVQKVDIRDTQGRMGKEQFFELRYHASWKLIGEEDYLTLLAEWQAKNKAFIEKNIQDHQTLVVELDHENAIVS